MFGYFLFGLSLIVYFLIVTLALQPQNMGGSDAAYGAAYSLFVVIVAFVLSSLFLTIYITFKGGFNWISNSVMIRNIAVAILWLGIVAGVAYCSAERTDYNRYYQLSGFVRLLSNIIYYGAIWLPLLMLIPYFLFLKTEWRDALSPGLFKIPLVLAPILGILLFMSHKIMKEFVLKSDREFDKRELGFNDDMERMKKYPSVSSLLYYTTKGADEQVRNAALTKIKASKNLEAELIEVLEKGSANTCFQAYGFLDENKMEHPERFIAPIVKSFDMIIPEMHEDIVSPYKGGSYDVDVIFRVLDGQFKGSAAVFKPSILKLQEIMETPPATSREYGDAEQVNEKINKNRAEIKKWLEAH